MCFPVCIPSGGNVRVCDDAVASTSVKIVPGGRIGPRATSARWSKVVRRKVRA